MIGDTSGLAGAWLLVDMQSTQMIMDSLSDMREARGAARALDGLSAQYADLASRYNMLANDYNRLQAYASQITEEARRKSDQISHLERDNAWLEQDRQRLMQRDLDARNLIDAFKEHLFSRTQELNPT